MNISFEGTVISNTLPMSDASNQSTGNPVKRGRQGQSGSNKRFRRNRRSLSYSAASIPSNSSMTDDSFSSRASLDDLAESLRECTQRLDWSLMDFSSNSHMSLNPQGPAGLNMGFGSGRMANTSPLFAEASRGLPPRSFSGPPALVNFTRVHRDSPDRL